MGYKQLLWLGTLVTLGIIVSPRAMAQTNQSDSSGGQTFSAPSVGIGGIDVIKPVLGTLSGSAIESIIGGTPSGTPGGISDGTSGGGNIALSQINSLEELSHALSNNLSESLDNLARLQNSEGIAQEGPRRIARRSSYSAQACGCDPNQPRRISRNPTPRTLGACGCAQPGTNARVIEARRDLNQQLEFAKQVIEQVEQADPDNYIW